MQLPLHASGGNGIASISHDCFRLRERINFLWMKRRRFKSNFWLLTRRPLVFARIYRWELLFLLVGATLDAVTTAITLSRYGVEAELHLAVRLMAHILGPVTGAVLGKIGQVVFVLLVASLWRPWCRVIILLCGGLYLLAAISNHFVLL